MDLQTILLLSTKVRGYTLKKSDAGHALHLGRKESNNLGGRRAFLASPQFKLWQCRGKSSSQGRSFAPALPNSLPLAG